MYLRDTMMKLLIISIIEDTPQNRVTCDTKYHKRCNFLICVPCPRIGYATSKHHTLLFNQFKSKNLAQGYTTFLLMVIFLELIIYIWRLETIILNHSSTWTTLLTTFMCFSKDAKSIYPQGLECMSTSRPIKPHE